MKVASRDSNHLADLLKAYEKSKKVGVDEKAPNILNDVSIDLADRSLTRVATRPRDLSDASLTQIVTKNQS